MKKLLLILAVSMPFSLSAQTALTLEDCRSMALEHNVYAVNAGLDLQAARYQKDEALSAFFPVLSVTSYGFHALTPLVDIDSRDILGNNDFANNLQTSIIDYAALYGFNTSYRTLHYGAGASVLLTQPVFAGGRIINGNKLASLGIEAASLQQSLQLRKTEKEVEELWWQVISLEEKMKTLESVAAIVDTLSSQVNSAISAGLASNTDILQVKLKKTGLDASRRQLSAGIRLARMNLFNAIGQKYTYYVSRQDQEGIPTLDDIVLVHEEDMPLSPEKYWREEDEIAAQMDESRLLDLQIESKKLERKMAIGETLPEIGIGGSYFYNYNTGNSLFNGLAFAVVKIPVTDWYKTSRKAQRLEIEVQKAVNERDYLNAQLHLEIGKSWLDLTSAYDQWQVAREGVSSADIVFQSLSGQYVAGLVSLADLLQAEASLDEASNNEADCLAAYRNAIRAYLNLCK